MTAMEVVCAFVCGICLPIAIRNILLHSLVGLECVRESVNHEKRRAVCSSESRCAIVLIAWRWYCLGFGTWKMEQCTESCWHFDGAYTTCRMRVKSCWDWSSAHRLAPRSAREPGVMRLCRLSTTYRRVTGIQRATHESRQLYL